MYCSCSCVTKGQNNNKYIKYFAKHYGPWLHLAQTCQKKIQFCVVWICGKSLAHRDHKLNAWLNCSIIITTESCFKLHQITLSFLHISCLCEYDSTHIYPRFHFQMFTNPIITAKKEIAWHIFLCSSVSTRFPRRCTRNINVTYNPWHFTKPRQPGMNVGVRQFQSSVMCRQDDFICFNTRFL